MPTISLEVSDEFVANLKSLQLRGGDADVKTTFKRALAAHDHNLELAEQRKTSGLINVIDRKFEFVAVNPVNGHTYTEEDAFILCAKDKAVIAALVAYRGACLALGANPEHIASVDLLTSRVEKFQAEVESRVPDTVGEEVTRCISGVSA